MTVTHKTALGLFPDRRSLETGVDRLKAAGFTPEQISVVVPESTGTMEEREVIGKNTTSSATIGAGTGAAIGGTLGLLAHAGVLAVPGIGAFLVLGPVGLAVIGTVAAAGLGTLIGSFIGLNDTADEIRVYEERLKKGEALASVECADEAQLHTAERVMAQSGAEKIYHKP